MPTRHFDNILVTESTALVVLSYQKTTIASVA